MNKLLQINYRLSTSITDFLGEAEPVANIIAKVEGLCWKIWLKNDSWNEGGGLYLFENKSALENFVNGPVLERLKAHPAIVELSSKVFDVPFELSVITRAPI